MNSDFLKTNTRLNSENKELRDREVSLMELEKHQSDLNKRETLAEVEKSGVLIYLSATPQSLLERVKRNSSKRPLFAGLSPQEQEQKLVSLMKDRILGYERAEIQIETDREAPYETATLLQYRLFGGLK